MTMEKTGYERALQQSIRRYKRRQGGHIAVLLLYAGVIIGRPAAVLGRNFHRFGDRGIPLALLTAVFLGPPFFFYLWYLWKYRQAIARLAEGNFLEVTGEITGKKGRRYTLQESLPQGLKKSSFQHLTRDRSLCLPDSSREGEFSVGETITVLYPASRILWRGMPEAVWAVSKPRRR